MEEFHTFALSKSDGECAQCISRFVLIGRKHLPEPLRSHFVKERLDIGPGQSVVRVAAQASVLNDESFADELVARLLAFVSDDIIGFSLDLQQVEFDSLQLKCAKPIDFQYFAGKKLHYLNSALVENGLRLFELVGVAGDELHSYRFLCLWKNLFSELFFQS